MYALGAELSVKNAVIESCAAKVGGGLVLEGCSGSFTDSRIQSNVATTTAAEGGGGVLLRGVQLVQFARNFISGNSASYGGGIELVSCNITISNCIVTRNSASTGAIFVHGQGAVTLMNNTIADNVSGTGPSSVYFSDSAQVDFVLCLFAYNIGPVAPIGRTQPSWFRTYRCAFWQNAGGTFQDPADIASSSVNALTLNPCFVSRSQLGIPLAYALGASSACVDLYSGCSVSDWNQAHRPVDVSGYSSPLGDAGAFEKQPVDQSVRLSAWRGPNGDGDQSSELITAVICNGNGDQCTQVIPQGADGFYQLGILPIAAVGPFDLTVRARGYLSQSFRIPSFPAPGCPGVSLDLVPGDADGDGLVSVTDLNLVLVGYGEEGTLAADIDGDRIISALDLNLILVNFGRQDQE